jgi:hypothetical protein
MLLSVIKNLDKYDANEIENYTYHVKMFVEMFGEGTIA